LIMTEQSRERNHAETERHCPGHYCGSAADPDYANCIVPG
jgi:hypothetical protein